MSSIFGKDTRPLSQVVTRRHPLAMAMYAMVGFLGLVFIFHWYGHHTEQELFPGVASWVIFAWKWMMVVGGVGGVASLLCKPRVTPHWPDLSDLLHIEGIMAIVGAFGLLTYLLAIVHVAGLSQSGPAIAVYTVLISGHVWRGVQAIKDAGRLELLSEVAQKIIERDEHGSPH